MQPFSRMKFCHKILETLGYHTVKIRRLSSHLGFERYRDVTDITRHHKTQDTKTELP